MVSMRLLIVEDNVEVRGLIKRALAGLGAEFVECGDGATACLLYGELQPDWVLMDIEMGEVDGIAATRRIKAEYPDARILIVTNHNNEQLREIAKAAGACGYVLKENL